MAAFATTTELQNWLQLDAIDTAPATLALNVASSDIRDHCGWPISEETVTEVLDGTGQRSLWLSTLKLTAVASVVVDAVTLVAGTDYDWTSYGKLIRNGCWPRTPRSVTVTYTHGYAVVPDTVKGVCLVLASRGYNNPEAVKARTDTAGPFIEAVTYAGVPGVALNEDELRRLGRYTIEHVG